MYGLVKQFIRVFCLCRRLYDFCIVSWLPPPIYPDLDPLTVEIRIVGLDVNNLDRNSVVSLNDIQPSRVAVEIDESGHSMFMMRMEGLDTLPS